MQDTVGSVTAAGDPGVSTERAIEVALEPIHALGLPQVIGHRGAAASAPENTLASIRKAYDEGATWVEFDVKLSADGVPILMHDDRLERTTDGQGRVAQRTLAQIRALDAGSWFGEAFRGERVPTFEEALQLCAELGLGINVEIKPCRGRAAETARAVVATLRAHGRRAEGMLLISSFNRECLAVVQDRAPEWPRGYLTGGLPLNWRSALLRYGCTTLHADHRRMRRGQIAIVAAAGVPVLLYTVNRAERARRLLTAGATAVFTDAVGDVLAAADPET